MTDIDAAGESESPGLEEGTGRSEGIRKELSSLLDGVDLGQPSTAGLRPVGEFFDRLLNLRPGTVYAAQISKNGNLKVRFEQSERARGSPVGLAVLYRDATRAGAVRAAKGLIERPGNAQQAVILCEESPAESWTVSAVIEANGGGVSDRLRRHFELIEVVAAKKAAQGATPQGEGTSGPQWWLAMQSEEGSKYADVEGRQYHYPLGIPNSLQIAEGDLLICHRPSREAPEGKRIFGVGRVDTIEPDGQRGRVARYDRYLSVDPALSFEELGGDPRNNPTNALVRVSAKFGHGLLERLGITSIDDLPAVEGDDTPITTAVDDTVQRSETGFEGFTFEVVAGFAIDQRLYVPDEVVATAVASLRSGKHLILIGPPGTGKTSFAQVLAEVARVLGIARGWVVVTATADWTSADTVGGYRQAKDGLLHFHPGHVLEAIDANAWLVIDELNRADVDKAFGQLFTVLSGQAVKLPFIDQRHGTARAPSIVPDGATEPPNTYAHQVSPYWRIIATLNTRDRDFLFRMSYALLRRFAVVEMPNPPADVYRELLRAKASTGSTELDEAIAEMIAVPGRSLGPAILLDCARYVQARRALGTPVNSEGGSERETFVGEAIGAFVLPQMDDLTPRQLQDVVRYVHQKVLAGKRIEDTVRMFATGLGVAARELMPVAERPVEGIEGAEDE
jgi:MoxR-like ATPase